MILTKFAYIQKYNIILFYLAADSPSSSTSSSSTTTSQQIPYNSNSLDYMVHQFNFLDKQHSSAIQDLNLKTAQYQTQRTLSSTSLSSNNSALKLNNGNNNSSYQNQQNCKQESIQSIEHPLINGNGINNGATCTQSESNSTLEENSDLDTSENNGKPPVIYAWMKKVHVNNAGK
jgi:hypothetical protein